MDTIQRASFTAEGRLPARFAQVLGASLTFLVGWIPRPIGTFVRGALYPVFLRRTSWMPYFHGTGIQLVNPDQIEVQKRARILRDVCIDASAPNSRIYIGADTWLGRGVEIGVSPIGNCSIEIKDFTCVGTYTVIHGPGNIRIGRNCLIAPHVGIFASSHIFEDPNINISGQGVTHRGIVIEDDCWLGTGVKVLDGVTIGRGSVIGAGAVVNKSIPPYSVAVGVPARVIASRKPSQVSAFTPDSTPNRSTS